MTKQDDTPAPAVDDVTDAEAAAAGNAARAAEAAGETTITITWRDLEFTAPRDNDDWPALLYQGLRDDELLVIVQGILGADQYERFMASTPWPTRRDLKAIYRDWGTALGLRAGESSASSD